jgi:CxxC motif-containing protein
LPARRQVSVLSPEASRYARDDHAALEEDVCLAEYLCIVCPMGCRAHVTRDDSSGELDIDGVSCKRGCDYVRQEATDPRRVLTTTLATAWGRPLPVRSAGPIYKRVLRDVPSLLASVVVDRAVKPGEVVVADIDGQGTALVATAAACPPDA